VKKYWIRHYNQVPWIDYVPHILRAMVPTFFSGLSVRSCPAAGDLVDADWRFIRRDVGLGRASTPSGRRCRAHTWNHSTVRMVPPRSGLPMATIAARLVRAAVSAAQGDAGQRVFVRFEAASIVSEFMLTAGTIGQHRGAFGAFC